MKLENEEKRAYSEEWMTECRQRYEQLLVVAIGMREFCVELGSSWKDKNFGKEDIFIIFKNLGSEPHAPSTILIKTATGRGPSRSIGETGQTLNDGQA